MTTPNSTDDDLLLAVRYLLDECEGDEVARFESRLADDPVAQSALVEATRIVAMLQATPSCPLVVAERSGTLASRFWKPVALVAAGLLAAFAISWQWLPFPHAPYVVTVNPVELHDVWAGLEPEQIAVEIDSSFDLAEASDSASDGSVLPISDSESAGDVPDWLLSAVLVEQERSTSDEL